MVGVPMKRLIGWVILAVRLHASLRAAQRAIGEVGRRPIPIRPRIAIATSELQQARNLLRSFDGGLSTVEEKL